MKSEEQIKELRDKLIEKNNKEIGTFLYSEISLLNWILED